MASLPEKEEVSSLGFYGKTRCIEVLNPRLNHLHCGTKFPRLVLPKKTSRQAINGVVRLDTVCERKYRSFSDPMGYYTGDVLYHHTVEGSCDSKLNKNDRKYTYWAPLPQLGREVPSKCTKMESFNEKSFCDSMSSFPCSSVSRTSTCSPVVEDERLVCFSKRKTIVNWIQGLGRGLQTSK